jgi:hypothetical protein
MHNEVRYSLQIISGQESTEEAIPDRSSRMLVRAPRRREEERR